MPVSESPAGEGREANSPTARARPSRLDRGAALAVLAVFAVTWPVLELLADNAEFFLARRSSHSEILLLAGGLLIAVPLLVASLAAIPGGIGGLIHWIVIALLGGELAMLYLRRTALDWKLSTGIALMAGCLLAWSFHRFGAARQVAWYLSPVPLVLFAVFVSTTPTGSLLTDQGHGVGQPIVVTNPVPVVMVVFDEFPLASIIDGKGNLRADRFPNFARLAADSTWFRNATTVEQQTEHSVPAMLTGYVPAQSLTPFAGQYPDNIFTALAQAYELDVEEPITQLCPQALCIQSPRSSTPLLEDVSIVAGHVLLPEVVSSGLPVIDLTWGNFSSSEFDARDAFREELQGDRREPIEALLGEIRQGTESTKAPFYFLHALVPHHPWQYLPDGRYYPYVVTANPASVEGGWNNDGFLVAQTMQRHLLQVGYADHVVGNLIAAMEEAGIYNDAVLVVVADHGIAIRPGVEKQRRITPDTIGEIAAVPLFIKGPGLDAGAIDDRRALTIDILPTIADLIGAEIPWRTEGVSLLDSLPERVDTTTVGPDGSVTYGTDGEEKLAVAKRIEEWFPGGDPWALRPPGSPELVGTRLDVGRLEESGLSVFLKEARLYQDVDLTGDSIPVRLGGYLFGGARGSEILAISVNGVVGAVTRSYRQGEQVSFLAMVPPTVFVEGRNDIAVIEVLSRDELRLVRPRT